MRFLLVLTVAGIKNEVEKISIKIVLKQENDLE